MKSICIQELKSLWKEVFHDKDEFIELFFNRVFRLENTLYIEDGGKIVSALQMVPYQMKIGVDIIPMAYVCGVCTREEDRGKGYMKRLMGQAMKMMKQKGYALSILIPAEYWLFGFYRLFGYEYPISISMERYKLREIRKQNLTVFPCSDDRYFDYFDRKQKERACTVLHDKMDFETIRIDCEIDGGNVWVALDGEKIVGMAFAVPLDGDKVFIKEIIYDNDVVKDYLIQHMIKQYHAACADVRIPIVNTCSANVYGVACVLDENVRLEQKTYMSLMLD